MALSGDASYVLGARFVAYLKRHGRLNTRTLVALGLIAAAGKLMGGKVLFEVVSQLDDLILAEEEGRHRHRASRRATTGTEN